MQQAPGEQGWGEASGRWGGGRQPLLRGASVAGRPPGESGEKETDDPAANEECDPLPLCCLVMSGPHDGQLTFEGGRDNCLLCGLPGP